MNNTPIVSTKSGDDTFVAGVSSDRPKAKSRGLVPLQLGSPARAESRGGAESVFSEAQQLIPSDPHRLRRTGATGNISSPFGGDADATVFADSQTTRNFEVLQDRYLRSLSEASGQKMEELMTRLGGIPDAEIDIDIEAVRAAASY